MNELYCDGGVVKINPSPIAGTYAWCYVVDDVIINKGSGLVYPRNVHSNVVSNNQTEFISLLKGLNSLPEDWIGIVKSDSQISLGRIFMEWRFKKGIADYLIQKYKEIKNKFLYWDQIKWVLLSGHPTRKELETGIGKNGLPCSKWNVWCDKECGRLASEILKTGG
jgi:ribonuclease HI